jgi:signal transduction histidine kinase
MRIVVEYLKARLKYILLLLCCFIINWVVLYLYRLPLEAVGYAAILCLWVIIVCSIADCTKYFRRHNQLMEMKNRITLSLKGLPEPSELIEKDYRALIEILNDDRMTMASEYDDSRSSMIDYYTLWAHQVKTPIAAMRLLLQSEENEDNQELSMELFKIEQYVEMVLQYLRLDSDSTDFVIQRYELDDIVKPAVRKYAKQFIRKRISLEYNEFNCQVLTDEKWLQFVVEQLLSNALKYTHEGSISIYIKENKTLVIEDTGIGIQDEDLPRVFEKGYTGYNGRADKKSTGIGLYLCKRVLTKLSHTIRIESQVGKGTRVIVGLDSINLEVE